MQPRTAAIDRARTLCTVLVVAYHAALPYTYISHREGYVGFDLFVLFNDNFFMSLMFFLSGVFVWPSLSRKGVGDFLHDRAVRLGLPFVISVFVLMPIGLYPQALRENPDIGLLPFWLKTISEGPPSAGPAWFLWVLLAFDAVAALLFRIAPYVITPITRLSGHAYRNPSLFFAALVGITIVAYAPLRFAFAESFWFEIGPFVVQATRPILYAAYFFAGVGVGAGPLDRGLLAQDGHMADRWTRWAFTAALAYLPLIALEAVRQLQFLQVPPLLSPPVWWTALDGAMVPTFCAAISLAILALFLHFEEKRWPILDALRDSAYGIYLSHYIFCLWIQEMLRNAGIDVGFKPAVTFVAAMPLSWGLVFALRRSALVRRVI